MDYDYWDVDQAYLELADKQRAESASEAEAQYQELCRKERVAIAAWEAGMAVIHEWEVLRLCEVTGQEYDAIMDQYMEGTGYTADQAEDLRDYQMSFAE